MAQRTTKPEVDLPPAGYERNEVLAERTDTLAEHAEEVAAALEVESINPNKFKIENEIAQHFDLASLMLKVSEADVTCMYCWVLSGAHGIMITQKQIEGWEVVQGDDPEALSHKGIGADTTRRIGDTLLMRIPKDKYLIIERRRRDNANRFDASITAPSERAYELANKHNIPLYDTEDMDARTLKRMMNQASAKKIASRTTDRLIRQGRMPGAKI